MFFCFFLNVKFELQISMLEEKTMTDKEEINPYVSTKAVHQISLGKKAFCLYLCGIGTC